MVAFREAYNEYLPENVSTSENIISAVNKIFNDKTIRKIQYLMMRILI